MQYLYLKYNIFCLTYFQILNFTGTWKLTNGRQISFFFPFSIVTSRILFKSFLFITSSTSNSLPYSERTMVTMSKNQLNYILKCMEQWMCPLFKSPDATRSERWRMWLSSEELLGWFPVPCNSEVVGEQWGRGQEGDTVPMTRCFVCLFLLLKSG